MSLPHKSLLALEAIEPAIRNEKIRRFAAYWRSIHPGDRLPARSDFDPGDIPDLLPHIVLVDVVRAPLRFQFRVQGTEVTRAMGSDFTGRYIDECVPDHERTLPWLNRVEVVETGCPVHVIGRPSIAFRLDYAPMERLHLPFAKDGETVDKILSMFLFQQIGAPAGTVASGDAGGR